MKASLLRKKLEELAAHCLKASNNFAPRSYREAFAIHCREASILIADLTDEVRFLQLRVRDLQPQELIVAPREPGWRALAEHLVDIGVAETVDDALANLSEE